MTPIFKRRGWDTSILPLFPLCHISPIEFFIWIYSKDFYVFKLSWFLLLYLLIGFFFLSFCFLVYFLIFNIATKICIELLRVPQTFINLSQIRRHILIWFIVAHAEIRLVNLDKVHNCLICILINDFRQILIHFVKELFAILGFGKEAVFNFESIVTWPDRLPLHHFSSDLHHL